MLDPTIREALADVLTEKVVGAIREMPGITSRDVRSVEMIVAAQLLTGQRSMSVDDAERELA